MAILRSETTAERVEDALRASDAPVIAAPTLLELSIVAEAKLHAVDGVGEADAARAVLDAADALTFPVDEHLVDIACDAWRRFGKRNHRASLDFGDCFSYALAHHLEVPLLCVGGDFEMTDVEVVDVTAG